MLPANFKGLVNRDARDGNLVSRSELGDDATVRRDQLANLRIAADRRPVWSMDDKGAVRSLLAGAYDARSAGRQPRQPFNHLVGN